jgi:hypothetical protein
MRVASLAYRDRPVISGLVDLQLIFLPRMAHLIGISAAVGIHSSQ